MELPAATKPTNANFVRVIRKNVQWIKVVTNDSIGTCSSELYSFSLFETSATASCGYMLTHIWIYIHVSSSKNVVVLHGEICEKTWDFLPPQVHLGWMFFEDNPLLGTPGFFAQAVFFPKQNNCMYFKLLRNHILDIGSVSHVGTDDGTSIGWFDWSLGDWRSYQLQGVHKAALNLRQVHHWWCRFLARVTFLTTRED